MRAVTGGTSQIMFLLIPFALYLVVFAFPLVTLYHFGAFTMDNVAQIAAFLAGLAAALPLYGVSSYLQKVFSSLRKMGVFALASVIASVVQVALTMLAVFAFQQGASVPIESIAWASVTFYLVADMARVRLPEATVRTRGHHVHRAGPACWARCWAVRARWRASACCRGSSSSSAP